MKIKLHLRSAPAINRSAFIDLGTVWLLGLIYNQLEWPIWWWKTLITGVVLFLGTCLTPEGSLLHRMFTYALGAYFILGILLKIFFLGYIPYRLSDGSWFWTIIGFIIFAILDITLLIISKRKC